MNIIEAQRSPRISAVSSRSYGRFALVLVAGLLSSVIAGCAATSEESANLEEKAASEPQGEKLSRETATEDEGKQGLSFSEFIAQGTTGVATTATIPSGANPEPQKPQPSPWKPGNNADPATPGGASSPIATPQPSPWQGYIPPGDPSSTGPNTNTQVTQ